MIFFFGFYDTLILIPFWRFFLEATHIRYDYTSFSFHFGSMVCFFFFFFLYVIFLLLFRCSWTGYWMNRTFNVLCLRFVVLNGLKGVRKKKKSYKRTEPKKEKEKRNATRARDAMNDRYKMCVIFLSILTSSSSSFSLSFLCTLFFLSLFLSL